MKKSSVRFRLCVYMKKKQPNPARKARPITPHCVGASCLSLCLCLRARAITMAFSAIEDLEEYMASERTVELFVPGRICLMGEHSDWAGSYRRFNSSLLPGMCLVSGTNQGLYARACRHPSKLIVTSIDQGGNVCGPTEFSMDPQALLAAAATGDHFSYVAGVAYQILVRCHVSGLVLHNYKTDLPARKGLSSSAAACVLAARAFNRVYDLKLTVWRPFRDIS